MCLDFFTPGHQDVWVDLDEYGGLIMGVALLTERANGVIALRLINGLTVAR